MTGEELKTIIRKSGWKQGDVAKELGMSAQNFSAKFKSSKIASDLDAGRSRLVFRQQKTHQLQYTDLNADARSMMGRRGVGRVFHAGSDERTNRIIKNWVQRAGIKKRITFHCARHTFATLLLTADVNLYVVSKLFGHASVKTTEIYAKVIDKKKREAVDSISMMVSNGKVTESEQGITADNNERL